MMLTMDDNGTNVGDSRYLARCISFKGIFYSQREFVDFNHSGPICAMAISSGYYPLPNKKKKVLHSRRRWQEMGCVPKNWKQIDPFWAVERSS